MILQEDALFVCLFFFQKQLVSAFWLLVLLCPCLNMSSVVSSELQYVLCALVYCSSILRLKYYQSVQAIFWFKAVLTIINCLFVCQCCSAPVYSSTSSTSTHLFLRLLVETKLYVVQKLVFLVGVLLLWGQFQPFYGV